MARSAKKRHQKKDTHPTSAQQMMNELQEKSGIQNIKYVERPEGMVSLSDAITEIIEPFREMADTFEAYQKIVAMACIAWNVELTSAFQRRREIRKAMKGFTGMGFRDRQDFKAIIKELVKRKELLYPNDKRMIVKYEVTKRKNDFHIQVAYAIPAKEYEKSK